MIIRWFQNILLEKQNLIDKISDLFSKIDFWQNLRTVVDSAPALAFKIRISNIHPGYCLNRMLLHGQ